MIAASGQPVLAAIGLMSTEGEEKDGAQAESHNIPSEEIAIDWNKVVFNMLTIKGIYGREMYETWYKMSVMLQSGLDISPVITHRFGADEFEKGFAVMKSGESGKVILDWKVFR